jgi:hypothetical protein
MNEELFMKAFGKESSLRLLMALHKNGPGTLYKLRKVAGLCSGRNNRELLESLVGAGLVNKRQVQITHRYHKSPSRTHEITEFSLNRVHEAIPPLETPYFQTLNLKGAKDW